MRPLKRPMFRTGGPIKEGVMNGLRDGGVATTMADATMMAGGGMPNMRGRVTGPGGYAGKTSMMDKAKSYGKKGAAALGTGYGLELLFNLQQAGLLGFKDGGRIGYNTAGIVDPAVTGKFSDVVKKTIKTSPIKALSPTKKIRAATGIMSNIYDKGKNLFNIQTLGKFRRQFPKAPVGLRGGLEKVPFMERAGAFLRLNPKTSIGAAYFSPEIIGAGKGLVENVALPIAKVIADPGGSRKKLYGRIKKKLGFEEEKTPPPGEDGTGRNLEIQQSGGPKVETQAEKDAKKAADDKKKLDRIYNLLGVKRAQANAASKALIDMSRYIDEGGKETISKENLGSTISKAIGAFDKRLDKADQLKEAAGLMMAKGEIEAMSDPYSKEFKKLSVEEKRKAARDAKDPRALKLALFDAKNKTLTHDGAVSLAKTNNPNAVVLADAEEAKDLGIGKDKSAIQYVQEQVVSQGGDVEGVYVVDKVIIKVDSQGNATQLLP
jgi:hypothetical protein